MTEYEELVNTLKEFEELEYDWNGNQAEPFTEEVISNAKEFLESVKEHSNVISVFPTARRSIHFEYQKDIPPDKKVYGEVEIFKDKAEFYFNVTIGVNSRSTNFNVTNQKADYLKIAAAIFTSPFINQEGNLNATVNR